MEALNKHRLRKSGQWALAAARLANVEHGGDRGNQHTGGKSPNGELATRDEIATSFGLSKRTIDQAKFVLAHGADFDLVQTVEDELPVLQPGCSNAEALSSTKLSLAFEASELQMFSGVKPWSIGTRVK